MELCHHTDGYCYIRLIHTVHRRTIELENAWVSKLPGLEPEPPSVLQW